MIFDLQVNPGIAPWPVLADAIKAAERAGFDTFWTMDHLKGAVVSAPDMPECFSLLGALAAVSTHIKLGPLVVNVGNRHPGILANAATTVQQISNGRLFLGLGAGGGPNSPTGVERAALGLVPLSTVRERHAALTSALDVLDDMWSPNRRAAFDTFPRPDPRPPILLGVNSVALAEIAGARTNGVNIRATNKLAPDVIAAARGAHDVSADGRPFTASVWDFYDEGLLRGDDARLDTWASWGVDRVILLMFRSVDVGAIERAERCLR